MKTILEGILATRGGVGDERFELQSDVVLGRAAKLAQTLSENGISRGQTVAVIGDRGAEAIISALGVLLTGACFTALEAELPEHAIDRRIRLANPEAFVGGRETMTIATNCGIRFKRPAFSCPTTLASSLTMPSIGHNDPAYAVFTSGTTGSPKLIQITHRNLASYCRALIERVGGPTVFAQRRVASTAGISVDLGYTTLFPGLMSSAHVYVISKSVVTDPTLFADFLRRKNIDVLKTTPSLFRELYAHTKFSPAKILIFGGEPLPVDMLEEVRIAFPHLQIYNHYGPAEACIGVACRRVDGLDLQSYRRYGLNSVPVGEPLDGVELIALDSFGNPVEMGKPGQLAVIGATVSPGCLTQLGGRQIDPLSGYETGDLAVKIKGQGWVVLGRVDRQVKISGRRVELLFVEETIRRCPGVVDAVVDLRNIVDSGPTLVAWLILSNEACDEAKLRDWVERTLEPPERPQILVKLPRFPLLPSGKIDRRQLLVPSCDVTTRAVPGKHTLQKVLKHVESLLARTVTEDEDLQSLTGSSLFVLRLVTRLRAEGVSLSIKDVYASKSIADLANKTGHIATQPPPASDSKNASGGRRLAMPHETALWLAACAAPSAVYQIPIVIEVLGHVTPAKVSKTFAETLEAHPAFRLRVLEDDDLAFAPGTAAIPVEEIRVPVGSTTNVEAMAWRASRGFCAASLKPREGKTTRAGMIVLAEGRIWLILSVHHIACDGASIEILLDDLRDRLVTRGKNSEQTNVEATFSETNALSFACMSADGFCEVSEFSKQTYLRFREAARRFGVSEYAFLCTAWSLVLARQTHSDEIEIAIPLDNRTANDERTVGYFIRPTAIRLDLRRKYDVLGLVSSISAVIQDALVQGDRGLEGEPASPGALLQVGSMVTLAHFPLRRAGDVTLRRLVTNYPMPMFGLDLEFTITDTSFVACLHASKAEFGLTETSNLLRRLEQVLVRLGDSGNATPVSTITGLDPGELIAIQTQGDGKLIGHPVRGLADAIVEAAARNPAKLAIYDGTISRTLQQLEIRSRQWVQQLRKSGVAPGDIVAIDLELGFDQLAALIGISRFRSIPLGLDPHWPLERKRQFLAEAVAVISISADFPNVIVPPSNKGTVSEREVLAPPQPDAAAYIVATSGSTGTPKLVALSFKALSNHFGWMRRIRPLHESDRVLVWTTLSFDVSIWERFAPLADGATIVILPGLGARDPVTAATAIVSGRVTVLQTTPTLLMALLEQNVLGEIDWVVDVFCGGEVLADAVVQRFRAALPSCRLHNLYGLAETAIDALACFNVHLQATRAPFDVIVDNLKVRIIDTQGYCVGLGEKGQLAIAGPSVFSGYWNDADNTKAKLMMLPECDAGPFFLTGDLARWERLGALSILGRTDGRIKLHGEGIELEDIESAILQCEGVREAAAIVDDNRIAAFVVLRNKTSIALISSEVRRKLPRAFVPTSWSVCKALPRTSTGKIDRSSLTPIPTGLGRNDGMTLPVTAVEKKIASIWLELLNKPSSVEENFFDAGGSSLLLLQLRTGLQSALGIDFTIADLFTATTIRSQAALFEQKAGRTERPTGFGGRGTISARSAVTRLARRRSRDHRQ